MKNYLKYLFSDKEAMTFWKAYYTIVILYNLIAFISYCNRNESEELPIFAIFVYIFLTLGFFIYYSYSYYFYILQEKFIHKYSIIIDENSLREINAVITPESYYMTAPMSNFRGKIYPKEKDTKIRICRIGKQFIIMAHTYHFGILRQHIKPLVFSVDNRTLPEKLKYAELIDNKCIDLNDNQIKVINSKPIYGIKSIFIKEWKV